MNIGTIIEAPMLTVKFKRKTLGRIEENFIIKVLEFIESKNLRVVPTSPRIAGFVRKNKSFKHLLPVGIKL